MKIIDIKFIKGRRSEIIEQEQKANANLMKLAKYRYSEFVALAGGVNSCSIEKWAHSTMVYSDNGAYKQLFAYIDAESLKSIKKSGYEIPVIDAEKSLERKILDMLDDGWLLKGDIISCNDTSWVQQMVKYETETLGVRRKQGD